MALPKKFPLYSAIVLLLANLGLNLLSWFEPNAPSKQKDLSCNAQMSLLLDNTDKSSWGLNIEASRDRLEGGMPFVWRISVRSKDGAFHQTFKSNDLCSALDTAWSKLDAYNAYVNDTKR